MKPEDAFDNAREIIEADDAYEAAPGGSIKAAAWSRYMEIAAVNGASVARALLDHSDLLEAHYEAELDAVYKRLGEQVGYNPDRRLWPALSERAEIWMLAEQRASWTRQDKD